MPLSDGDLSIVRSWVGNSPTADSLNERYTRLGTVDATILEELTVQYTAMLDRPSSLSAPDGSSISFSSNISAMSRRIELFRKQGSGTATSGVTRLVRPNYR